MFKKIVSGIMSAVIAAGILPQLQIVGSAEITSTSGRIAYEGYDDTNANYLEYDGSMIPDMSWYDEATGTEDDPYIIDSAEDLLALSYISQYGLREFSGDIDYSRLVKTTGIYESMYKSVYIPSGSTSLEDVYVIAYDNIYARLTDSVYTDAKINRYYNRNNTHFDVDIKYKYYDPVTESYSEETIIKDSDFTYSAYVSNYYDNSDAPRMVSWYAKILDTPDSSGNLQMQAAMALSSSVKGVYYDSMKRSKTVYIPNPDDTNTKVTVPFIDPWLQDNWVNAVSITGKAVRINLNDEVTAGNIYRVNTLSNRLRNDFVDSYDSYSSSSTRSVWNRRDPVFAVWGAGSNWDASRGRVASSKLYAYTDIESSISDLNGQGALLFKYEADYDKRIYGKLVNEIPAYRDEFYYADVKTNSQLRLKFDEINGETVLCIQEYATNNALQIPDSRLSEVSPCSQIWLRFDGVDFSTLEKFTGFTTNTLSYQKDDDPSAFEQKFEIPLAETTVSDTSYYEYPIYSFKFQDTNGNPIEIIPSEWCFSDTCNFTSWNTCSFVNESSYDEATCPRITMHCPDKRMYVGICDVDSCGDYISYETDYAYWTSTVDGHTTNAPMIYLGTDLLDNDIDELLSRKQSYTQAQDLTVQLISNISDITFEDKYFKFAANFKWNSHILSSSPLNGIFKGNFDFDGHILYNLSETDYLFNYFEGAIKNAIFVSNGGTIIENMTGNLDNITFITPGCLKSISNTPKEYSEFHTSTKNYISMFGHQYSWSESQAAGFVPERVSATNIKVIRNIGQGMRPFGNADYADISNVNSLFVDDSISIPADKTIVLGTAVAGYMNHSTLKHVVVDADTDNLGAALNLNAGNTPLAKASCFICISGNYCNFEDIWVKDFNINTLMDSYRYFSFSDGTIKNVTFEFSTVLAEDRPWTENQSMYLSHSTIDNLICRGTSSLGFGNFYVCNNNISNSQIGLDLSENASITTAECYTVFSLDSTNLNNCKLYLKDLSGTRPVVGNRNGYCLDADGYTSSRLLFKDTIFDFSTIKFKGYRVADFSYVDIENCSFEFDDVYLASSGTTGFGDYYDYEDPIKFINSSITINGLESPVETLFGGIVFENSTICINDITSLYAFAYNTDIKNCKIDLNYANETHTANNYYDTDYVYAFCGVVEDTDIIITAPDDATGNILTPISIYSAKNVFISMDLSNTDINVMPKPFTSGSSDYSASSMFGSTSSPYRKWSTASAGAKDCTYIFKGNIKRTNAYIVTMLGCQPYSSYNTQTSYENVNVVMEVNELVGFDARTPVIGGISLGSEDNLIKAFNFMSNTSDNPRILGLYERYSCNLMADSVSVISNSTNPQQFLIEFYPTSSGYNRTISNSLLYTPNNMADYSAEHSGVAVAGLSYGNYYPVQHNTYAAWFTSDYANIFHNCYVGKGQSIQYSNPTAGINMDSCYLTSIASQYPDAVWDATEDREYAGIKKLENDDILSGEAAYLLDKGFAYNRRGYNWTVYDEVEIIDPQTSEVITTIPAHTGPIGMYIPEQYLGGVALADEPIYKLTMKPATDGEIKITGLQDLSTTNGSIYTKRGSYLQAEEIAYNDGVSLIYALESLNGGSDIRIPNQNSGTTTFAQGRSGGVGYTINGYKLPGADISITPVFKIARNITIDVNDAENGNIVPSDYISAEGEKVYLSLTANPGYIVSNLYWNTVSDPDTTYPVDSTAMEIVMPADDIVIHGTVSPMECGITKFNVLGFDGVIDQIKGTIDVWVPKIGQLNHTIPEITYFGDYMTPSETTFVDLTMPCTYTVYKDTVSKTYDINIHQSEYSMRIYSFKLNGVEGEINQASQKIVVRLPMDTDISNLVPEIVYSAETITPSDTVAQDFRMPIVYTLYTTSMTPVPYTVEVVLTASDEAIITNYTLAGFEGIINQDTKQIIVNVPKALNLEHIRPNLVEYVGKRITPNKVATINASTPVEYVVTAQNGNVATYTLTANRLSDNTAKITQFTLGGVDGIIDEENHTISVVVPATTSLVDVAPDILTYEGKSIYPNKTLVQDFSQPVEYTVVAVDNTEVTYTVTVTKASNEALITEFAVYGINGTIDQTAKTISVVLPYGYSIDNLVPSTLTYSNYAVLSPSKTVARDFTNPVVYSVTSQDGTVTNDYTVTITNRAMYDNLITKYTLDGVEGKITNIGSDSGTIHITVNEKDPPIDFSNKTPDEILISELATIDKDTSVAVDYINGIPEYTVTGLYNGARTYKVYLTVVPLRPDPNPGTNPNPNPGPEPEFSDDCGISYYQALGIIGAIDQNSLTITMSIPEKLKDATRGVTPDSIIWTGTNLSPDENKIIDLVDGMKYIVTAESGKTKTYTIRIIWLPGETEITPSKDCSIIEYYANGVKAVIDQSKFTITFKASESDKDKWANVIPDRIVWIGDKLTPTESGIVNLTDKTVYRVYAEDQNVFKDYSVIVDWVPTDKPTDNPDTGYTAIWDICKIVFLILILGATIVVIDKKKKYYR